MTSPLRKFLIQKGLSRAEVEVALIVSRGVTNCEASEELHVTEKTVKFHLTNIYKKMKCKNRQELIIRCAPFSDKEEPIQKDEVDFPSNVPGLPKGNEIDL